jgi:hypothetical protein
MIRLTLPGPGVEALAPVVVELTPDEARELGRRLCDALHAANLARKARRADGG